MQKKEIASTFPRRNEMQNDILDLCNINILGAWNISIINPIWLKEQFPHLFQQEKYEMSLKISPNPTFLFNEQSIDIEYSNDKLLVSTKEDSIEKVKLIKSMCLSIVEKLPHTPIFAIGHNYTYVVKNEFLIRNFFVNNTTNNLIHSLKYDRPIEERLSCSFALENSKLNIYFIKKKDNNTISFNYHYQIDLKDTIYSAIKAFENNFNHSKELLLTLGKENDN